MFLMAKSFFLWFVLVSLVYATDASKPTYALPPSEDPFYIPPKDYTKRAAGSILRHRKLDGVSANVTIHAAYQLLYRTTDALGNPSAAITTVLIPPHANYSQHLSYQTAYDQADPDCVPSYGLRIGANTTTGVAEIQTSAAVFLAKGIPVSTSDYEGLNAAFTSGPQSAYGVLDSIRAVMSSTSITGIRSSAETIMFGYSGGCLASEWAAEYAAQYAGELNIIGAAMGGMPVNLTSGYLGQGNGGYAAGLIFASAQGLAASYSTFAECLDKALIPETATQFHAAESTCNYGALFAYANVWSYFRNGVSFLSSSCWKDVVNKAGVMGLHGVPKKFPLYMYKGTADEIVPTIEQTDALIEHYCDHGAQIQYVRYINGTHGSTAAAGQADAFQWLFGLLDGAAAMKGCSVTNVTIPTS